MTINLQRVDQWLADARQRLTAADPEKTTQEAGVEALALLCHQTQKPKGRLLAHPETELEETTLNSLEQQLLLLIGGVPLPYLTGHQEFYGLKFAVTPDVLIPRPETELLVERALEWLRAHPHYLRAADVGTGSGCIAVTLAAKTAHLQVTAVDWSMAALRVARRNIDRHNLTDRITLYQGDLLTAAADRSFNLICANLPYIPTQTTVGLEAARHEPTIALDGGPDGLRLIERLMVDAPRLLITGGLILLEIEAGQGEAAGLLAKRYFPRAEIKVLPDLAGRARLVSIDHCE